MNGNFIVSLASYSKRINTLHICLESIFSQTLTPKKIILYLDNSVQIDALPVEITAFIDKGLEIISVSDDILSHNKYYYTFKEYPDDIIITVDDDVIYGENTFFNLMQTPFEISLCCLFKQSDLHNVYLVIVKLLRIMIGYPNMINCCIRQKNCLL